MISVAVVRTDNGTVLAQQTGRVSASADPAFSFSGLLVVGVAATTWCGCCIHPP